MAGTAEHSMQRVTERSLQRIPIQSTIRFHVSYCRLNCTSPIDHGFQPASDAASLA